MLTSAKISTMAVLGEDVKLMLIGQFHRKPLELTNRKISTN